MTRTTHPFRTGTTIPHDAAGSAVAVRPLGVGGRRSAMPSESRRAAHFVWHAVATLALTAASATFAQAPSTSPAASTSPALPAATAAGSAAALRSLPTLDVPPYMGTWYQVALFPNVFQRSCVSDTTATYRLLASGAVEVTNRCRTGNGAFEQVVGAARPTASLQGRTLTQAQLEVSFLPSWLRWLPVGWGRYWVIQLADDGRYAVVSEPSREYLWILSRQPQLSPADDLAIRAALIDKGFDLSRLQRHPHGAP